MFKIGVAASLAASATATTYLKEDFNSKDWKKKWTVGSDWKPSNEMGEFAWTEGEYGADKGIKTGPDARFFSLTAPLDTEFKNDGKDLILSYTVRHEQNIDCGGAYIKLLPPGFDAKKFGGETPYSIMFGPDVCGTSTRKTHVIVTHDKTNHLVKKNVRVETDRLPHRYTLILRPDNTYEVQIDGTKAESGSLLDDFDILPRRKIEDASASQPADWVTESEIADSENEKAKPSGWDDLPDQIPDPAAKKPEDWDEEEDGEWEAPKVANPAKDAWKPKKMPNPAFKGAWRRPLIENPDFKEVPNLHAVCNPCGAVGFELWQVKAGTAFDDIIVTDSMAEAEAFADETFNKKKEAEKTKHDDLEKAKREKEEADRKKAEEDRAKTETKESKEEEGEEEKDDGEL